MLESGLAPLSFAMSPGDPGDTERARRSRAIEFCAGSRNEYPDVVFWRKGDTDPSLILDRWSAGGKVLHDIRSRQHAIAHVREKGPAEWATP